MTNAGNMSTMLKNARSMMPAPALRAAKAAVSTIPETGHSIHAKKGGPALRPRM